MKIDCYYWQDSRIKLWKFMNYRINRINVCWVATSKSPNTVLEFHYEYISQYCIGSSLWKYQSILYWKFIKKISINTVLEFHYENISQYCIGISLWKYQSILYWNFIMKISVNTVLEFHYENINQYCIGISLWKYQSIYFLTSRHISHITNLYFYKWSIL